MGIVFFFKKMTSDEIEKDLEELLTNKRFVEATALIQKIEKEHRMLDISNESATNNDKKGSFRVLLMKGMLFEAEKKYDKALQLYRGALAVDQTNVEIVYRTVCLFRQTKRNSEAIELLNSYLSICCADVEAWKELALIYIEQLSFDKAKFCIEEMLLLQPNDANVMQMYAELLYTIDDTKQSRLYAMMALDAKPDYMRSKYL